MKRFGYSLLLETLKQLVVVKRVLVSVTYKIKQLTLWLDTLVVRTIGFRLYIWQKKFEKYGRWYRRLQSGRVLEFVGQRYVLQTILVCIGLVVAFPHSNLYTKETSTIPGRDTRLYALAGPGDQDFSGEEVVVRRGASDLLETDRTWDEGAIGRPIVESGAGASIARANTQVVGLVSGGRALIKPTVLSGEQLIDTSSELGTQQPSRRGAVTYTVQPGDVLGSIATQFGISVETILWANNLTVRSVIRPGDVLTILPTTGVIHTVKSGDTLGRIARLYDAEIGDILDENNLASAGTIQIGQELIIPGGSRLAAAPAPVTPVIPTPSSPTVRPTTPVTPPPASTAAASGAGYIWPTSVRTITQYFGWRHTAVDIAGPIGSPLYAARAGTVIKSQCGWNGGYGCYVILDHGDGIQTLYAHASELYVSVGDTVDQGDTLAAMGSTGRSTGPHIHFEVRVGGKQVNPFNYVN